MISDKLSSRKQPDPDAEIYALGLLAEECGEVVHLVGKALRFGMDTPGRLGADGRVTDETPRSLLLSEVGDLLAAIDFATAHGLLDAYAVELARTRKIRRLLNPAALDNLGAAARSAADGRGLMGEAKRRVERQTPMERVADEVSRELANKGRVIEGGWAAHCLLFVPKGADSETVDALRFAYMAGSQHLWASIFAALDPDVEPTAADMDRMSKIAAEIAAWTAEAARDQYPTKGSA